MTPETLAPGTARGVLLEVSSALNGSLREIGAAMVRGTPPPALVTRARVETLAGLRRLKALDAGGDGALGASVAKVVHHLDLVVTLMDSLEAAPALSRKLLSHLLDEQLEITAGVERAPSDLPQPRPAAPSPNPTPTPLGGGRRPLTVGSLIGR
jgi:hypothetical protein